MPNEQRFRNFSCILYTDSAAPGFISAIDSLHVPAFLSPLHDGDIAEDGTPKKPHYHLLVMFEGKKSVDQVRKLFMETFGGVGLEVCQSIRGSARYLCHLDNPEKAQYSSVNVKCFGGADYTEVIMSEADRVVAYKSIVKIIDDNNLYYFHQLIKFLQATDDNLLLRQALFGCNAAVNQYLNGKREQRKVGNPV